MLAPQLVTRKETIVKICRAIEDVRASRTDTQHAIERSRRSLGETHALLVALRLQVSGANRPASSVVHPRQKRPTGSTLGCPATR